VRGVGAPVVVLVALLAGWGVDTARTLARLPDRMAVHFGASGAANGWMTPRQFAVFNAGLLLFVTVVMIGSAVATRFIPTTLINIPHRDYWFAPERRRASRDRLLRHMLWLVCVVVGFLVTIDHSVLAVNLRPGAPRLSGTELGVPVGVFLLGIAVWTLRLLVMFRRPRA
jgi:uncharacterized membrane protein